MSRRTDEADCNFCGMPLWFFEDDGESTLADEPVFWFDELVFCSKTCTRAFKLRKADKGVRVIARYGS